MPETPLAIILLLGLISACLLAMTITCVQTARKMCRTLDRIDAMLPAVHRIVRDAHDSMQQVRSVVHEACAVTSEALGRARQFAGRVQSFMTGHVGNGARGEPRHTRHG